jgi:hypothetical protein
VFAPNVAKPRTKATEGSTSSPARMLQQTVGHRAALRLPAQRTASPSGNEPGGYLRRETNPNGMTAPAAPSAVSWDFSETPLFPPNQVRAPPRPSVRTAQPFGMTDASCVADRSEVDDTSPGSGSASPAPAPAPAASKAPIVPTVDRIDLVNTSTGAISGYPAVTSGDLNTPGPFNNSTTNGVSHSLQVHFHLDNGNSSALTPRREIQRTSTSAGADSKNPPDRPPPGGVGPSTPGGFKGVIIGPDGPAGHEIKRPTADKIVVADAPGFASMPTGSFPVTYKAHFAVTVAAASTDIARINYDVLIDKRTATEVPNTENRSVSTQKSDLVRGRALT